MLFVQTLNGMIIVHMISHTLQVIIIVDMAFQHIYVLTIDSGERNLNSLDTWITIAWATPECTTLSNKF